MLPSAQTIAEPMPFTVQPHLAEASPIVCQHNNPIAFICRSQKCLKCDSYLVCSQDCIVSHFKHPEDLIPYQTFTLSLPSLRKQQINMQLSLSSILRETINKLLHLRITVSQQIDKELEKVKSMMVLYQRENEPVIEGESEKRIQKIKEYIYKIQDYNKNEDTIVYNVEREQEEEEKQVEEDVKRMWRRLGRNIKELLGTDIGIFEGEEVSEKQKKKCYEYKVEGNITKVVKLIKSTPKHVDRLKIYLNEDTQPKWYADMGNPSIIQRVNFQFMAAFAIINKPMRPC